MFKPIELFSQANAMARHAAAKQSVVAENVANADTPGFKAKDVAPQEMRGGSKAFRATRPAHLMPASQSTEIAVIRDELASSKPNGNSVSLEMEMLKSIEAERSHGRAIAVYQSALNVLKTSIGRGR